jgi:hypothetical protein
MNFYKHFLDPTKNRKVKGLILATTLLVTGFITDEIWVFAFTVFIGGNFGDKYLEKK